MYLYAVIIHVLYLHACSTAHHFDLLSVSEFIGHFDVLLYILILLQQDFRKMYKALAQNEAFEGFKLGER